jgi:hypothetical protein
MPGPVLGQGGRCTGQIGGEIKPAHIYYNEEKVTVWIIPSLVLFRLVAHPLQPGVVEPYMVWGVWFPNYLLLERTHRIQNFGP